MTAFPLPQPKSKEQFTLSLNFNRPILFPLVLTFNWNYSSIGFIRGFTFHLVKLVSSFASSPEEAFSWNTLMHSPRHLLRLAGRLQTAWQAKPPPLPTDRDWQSWQSCIPALHSAQRRWQLAHQYRLKELIPTLYRTLRIELADLARRLDRFRTAFDSSSPDTQEPPLPLTHWIAELRQLEDEFDELQVNRKAQSLSVMTEPITLKDIQLGRFEIVFVWNRIGTITGVRCFDCRALDPNPPIGKESTTHPHVRDDELCAGDAARPIEDALRDGRLADAFMLIRSVLTTYNSRSPYVSLEDWEGISCGDCGDSIDQDESSSCEGCFITLCDSCRTSCVNCSDTRCPDCLSSCETCHDRVCPGCLETINDQSRCSDCVGTCAECQTTVFKEDLSAEMNLCPTCSESLETHDDSTTNHDSTNHDRTVINDTDPTTTYNSIPLNTFNTLDPNPAFPSQTVPAFSQSE